MAESGKRGARLTKHHLQMRGNSQLYIKGDVVVSFTPLRKKKGIVHRSILPTFNHDRKCYTLAFRLPSSDPDNDQQMAEDHERRVIDSQHQPTDIYYPKPRSRHRYCGVCRSYYEDYKEHVEDSQHLGYLRRSYYHILTVELTQKYREKLQAKEEEEKAESFSEEPYFKYSMSETMADNLTRSNQKIEEDLK